MSESAFTWSSASASVTGNVRKVNEDACLELPQAGLWMVADGMGGHDYGDVASQMVVDALRRLPSLDSLSALAEEVEDHLTSVNANLYARATSGATPTTIGCTVAGVLARGHCCLCVWAGDSRVYRYSDGRLEQITRDHSQTEELIEQGIILREAADDHPAANVITRAVGGAETLFLDSEFCELRSGDRYLICSDGLNKELSDEEIAEIAPVGNTAIACTNFVHSALQRDCIDNTTVIVIQFDRMDGE